LNVEYRFKLIQGIETSGFRGIEAIFFGDFGQVFNSRQDFAWSNIRSSWGGGLQFTSRESVALAMLYAQSPEGGKLIMRFGKTF
jgi:outer membrane protein assembly factor BamA